MKSPLVELQQKEINSYFLSFPLQLWLSVSAVEIGLECGCSLGIYPGDGLLNSQFVKEAPKVTQWEWSFTSVPRSVLSSLVSSWFAWRHLIPIRNDRIPHIIVSLPLPALYNFLKCCTLSYCRCLIISVEMWVFKYVRWKTKPVKRKNKKVWAVSSSLNWLK